MSYFIIFFIFFNFVNGSLSWQGQKVMQTRREKRRHQKAWRSSAEAAAPSGLEVPVGRRAGHQLCSVCQLPLCSVLPFPLQASVVSVRRMKKRGQLLCKAQHGHCSKWRLCGQGGGRARSSIVFPTILVQTPMLWNVCARHRLLH